MREEDRLACLLVTLLDAAKAGGMAEARAWQIYEELVTCYGRMQQGFAGDVLQQAQKALHAPSPDEPSDSAS